MTDLVTPAAIAAALPRYRLLHPCSDAQPCDGCEVDLRHLAEKLAPHIAAEALRQAARELLAFKDGQNLGYDRGIETALTYLGSRADELEGE